jgi:hypothetical protein
VARTWLPSGSVIARHVMCWCRPRTARLRKDAGVMATSGPLWNILSPSSVVTTASQPSPVSHDTITLSISNSPLGSTTKNFYVPTLLGLRRSLSTYAPYALGIVNWYFYQYPDNPTSTGIKYPFPSNDTSTKQHHTRLHHGTHVETHIM